VTASPEQAALLADPATSAATLQSLAAANPELWPAIAAHPNVYPDLLAWMHENGLPHTPAVAETVPDADAEPPLPEEPEVEPEPEPEPEPEAEVDDEVADDEAVDEEQPDDDVREASEAPTEAPTEAFPSAAPLSFPSLQADRLARRSWGREVRTWVGSHRKILIAVGGGIVAAILALVLVVNLVVVPQQVAAQAAADAAAALDEAITDFDRAASDCSSVNTHFTNTVGEAEEKTTVDPALLADPSVIDALRLAITDVEGTELCDPPTMAEDIEAIDEQTRLLNNDVSRINKVIDALSDATVAVDTSIFEKEQADAAAAAAAQAAAEAAERAARTWTMSDSQGYGFTATLSIDAPTTTASGTIGNTLTESGYSYELGDACGFDPAVDIAIPITMKVTATTQGFDTIISALVTISQSGRVSTPHEIAVEAYYSEGPQCKTPTYGSTILNGVQWADPMETGASGNHEFFVIIRQWKTPATPNGDTAFLDNVSMRVSGGQGSSYSTSSNQQLFLSNRVK
jgi:type II secretory pathway pseudopilin PulG